MDNILDWIKRYCTGSLGLLCACHAPAMPGAGPAAQGGRAFEWTDLTKKHDHYSLLPVKEGSALAWPCGQREDFLLPGHPLWQQWEVASTAM